MTGQKKSDAVFKQCEALIQGSDNLEKRAEDMKKAVDEIRDAKETTEAAKALFHIKEAYEALDNARKAFYHIKDYLEKAVVPELMEANDIDMLRVPELARSFSRQQKMSASFVDREKGFQWLREKGQGDLITETVNAGTLTAFCRNMIIDEGIDPPDDLVRVNTYYTTGITKYNPK